MDFHPVSEIFPLMTGTALDELAADIKANGLQVPIWTHQGKIIDGRNRYQACQRASVKPTFQEWDGNGELVKFVVSLNLHRRHLNESQRGMVASKLANGSWGGDRKSDQVANWPLDRLTTSDAAELLNVGRRTVTRAGRVRQKATPEVVAAVERGEMTIHAAAKTIGDEIRRDRSREPARIRKASSSTTKTRTHAGRKAPEAIRGAIGTLVGLATGLDSFTVEDAAPTADEAAEWERELAVVISAINRFRKQLKGYEGAGHGIRSDSDHQD